jgi:hypothetical protein
MLHSWFMTPLNKKSLAGEAAKIGTWNEPHIIENLPGFFEDHQNLTDINPRNISVDKSD